MIKRELEKNKMKRNEFDSFLDDMNLSENKELKTLKNRRKKRLKKEKRKKRNKEKRKKYWKILGLFQDRWWF